MSRRNLYNSGQGYSQSYGRFSTTTMQRSSSGGSFSHRPPSRTGSGRSAGQSRSSGYPMQRTRSASGDVYAFAESVQTPPPPPPPREAQPQVVTSTSTAFPSSTAATAAPFPPPTLTRTMSGGSTGFGSMYNGFYETPVPQPLQQHNSFYNNLGSFYGGFQSNSYSQFSSRNEFAPSPGSLTPQPEMGSAYGHLFGSRPAVMSDSVNTSPGEVNDQGAAGLARSNSSSRILRRKVSFSGVPTPTGEEDQRTVAQSPKRVGSRRLNVPHHDAAIAGAPPQQQQQQTPVQLNQNAGMMNRFGSMYMPSGGQGGYGVPQNYGPYGGAAAPYNGGYGRPMNPPLPYPQSRFNPYASSPMMMPPRPMMNGYYY